MIRKIACILSAVGLLAVVSIPARASGCSGTLRVIPSWCGTSVPGGTVTVQAVGKPVEGGYALTDGLADWVVWKGELDSEVIRDWIVGMTRAPETIKAVKEGEGACFPELDPGLYLVSQRESALGFDSFFPFLVEIPAEGQWEVTETPAVAALGESPRTGDRPAPILMAMGISFLVAVVMVLGDSRKK